MLTEIRWQKEQELMQSVFPEFKGFKRGSLFGFDGYVKSQKSGNSYHVILEADETTRCTVSPDRVRLSGRAPIPRGWERCLADVKDLA